MITIKRNKARGPRITHRLLLSLGACSDQRQTFRAAFGTSAIANDENAVKAADAGLDIDWIASRVLTDPAWAEYQRVMQPAWAEYERVRQAAWAEYERVRQAAWAEYERTKARAFVRAYVMQADQSKEAAK